MLFQGLNKLKRRSIMSAIVLLAIGIIIVACPETYIPSLVDAIGIIALVISFVMIFDFVGSSKKSLVNFVLLTCSIALLIVGLLIMVFELKTVEALAIIFGIALIISGLYSMIYTLVFARRSGRKGWWVMVILSALVIFAGILVIVHPWWNTPEALMKFIGLVIVFIAITSAVRLIWIWPIKGE